MKTNIWGHERLKTNRRSRVRISVVLDRASGGPLPTDMLRGEKSSRPDQMKEDVEVISGDERCLCQVNTVIYRKVMRRQMHGVSTCRNLDR